MGKRNSAFLILCGYPHRVHRVHRVHCVHCVHRGLKLRVPPIKAGGFELRTMGREKRFSKIPAARSRLPFWERQFGFCSSSRFRVIGVFRGPSIPGFWAHISGWEPARGAPCASAHRARRRHWVNGKEELCSSCSPGAPRRVHCVQRGLGTRVPFPS